MFNMKEIAWLGGLLEGEGCFRLAQEKYPNISVGMTAEDTITKVANMWDTGISHRGNVWVTQVNGSYAIQWMLTLYPFLNKTRRSIIIEAVKFWRKDTFARSSRGIRRMAKCHPDRVVQAYGLCSLCYSKEYYKNKKKK